MQNPLIIAIQNLFASFGVIFSKRSFNLVKMATVDIDITCFFDQSNAKALKTTFFASCDS